MVKVLRVVWSLRGRGPGALACRRVCAMDLAPEFDCHDDSLARVHFKLELISEFWALE
jgi:hypothetical protein